ncbi:hypothetical protein RYA05_04520 [Pseudomonas syringae pv. actinidiae]|nr:hypothetical protein [Pseudomonas syringae pv. actinidiae]
MLDQAFLNWFSGSVVVTPTGEPLRVYHGTARLDRAFRTHRFYDAAGAYFTDSYACALDYAEMDGSIDGDPHYVIEAYVRLLNPVRLYGIDSHIISDQQLAEFVALGHDGVLGMTDDDVVFEFVVFDPANIAVIEGDDVIIPQKMAA